MPDDFDGSLRHRIAPTVTAEEFDQNLADTAASVLLNELNQAALGDQAVPGLLTYSFVTRWDLDQAVDWLNLEPGRLLLDLACGRGGPGLWLAERTGCDLVGVDFAEEGLRIARERAEAELPGSRTRFQRGDLADTGLPDASVDGVWCGDAFFFAADLIEALCEVRRVLRAGGRLVMTVCVSQDDQPSVHPLDWRPLLEHVGLFPLRQQDTPDGWDHARATYAAWIAHETELRAELPGRAVDDLIDEARSVGDRLSRMRRVLVIAER